MSLSDEIRNFDSCASDYIREDWAARIEELEAENQKLQEELKRLPSLAFLSAVEEISHY